MNLDKLLQNISDCSTKATVSINAIISLVTALISFGEKAYPYAVKIIDSINEMFETFIKAGDDAAEIYENFVAQLKALKTNLETKIAEKGVITLGEYDAFIESVKKLHELQESAENEEVDS